MGELKVENKTVVVPGDILADGMDFLPSFGTYRFDDKIIASMVGLVRLDGKVIKLIPLSGRYIPKVGDTVIGKVIDILMTGWRIEINSPYTAVLSLKDATTDYIEKGADLTKYFSFDQYVVAKIVQVTTQKLVDLTMKGQGLRKLRGGRVIEVNTNKVPRIIGKQGSMVSMIKKYTGCQITVGQNGIIWINGEDPTKENVSVEAIKKIEHESHIAGLTDSIKTFLEDKTR